MPVDAPINNLVYCAAGQDVDTTIVDGQILMDNRQMLGMNERQVIQTAVESAERVKARWRQRNARSNR